ncbi:MAG: NADH-quinone oxidoreductase subunit L [Planctomycetes bacterium]|nr:NADH-quinone oxidoreductase subunit L [Planctomycetota bacterium]
MELGTLLSNLLLGAWLLPLASFALIVLFGPRMGKAGKGASYVATGAILGSLVLSSIAMFYWVGTHGVYMPDHGHGDSHASAHASSGTHHEPAKKGESAHDEDDHEKAVDAAHGHAAKEAKTAYFNDWYTLAHFGRLKLTIGYYIDALTIVMFVMVTIIASCIHFYAIGYMHDELHEVTDHEVTLADGHHLHRPGRFHRFFQYLSLFCFSMLGIVVAGNIAMVFVFWELVGICSYFLIWFYFERKSASTAANKAFIVNRVGDFGMIIGMCALFGAIGTFQFGGDQGIFAQVRPEAGSTPFALRVPDGMVIAAATPEVAKIVDANQGNSEAAQEQIQAKVNTWRSEGLGYGLLVVAGLGIFCGCMGKSAQFPLHVWLPDAMEGPTPVSALVHSATMVAAGVYLVGRFYPVFTPEVLLTIAIIGCITLFMAATIAITAVDIKRVLAYSTLSQLGYMMFALGVGGWLAGMLHLITHAFFKSLLFMCSGSVIHAVHTNDMREMGGLRKKMPITAYTMLIGCLAIIGAGLPLVAGLSGYYSKDAILAQALLHSHHNKTYAALFYLAAGGAAITAFYMFRLWYMTFTGKPRDHHKYEHAHESPKVMWIPLVVLAFFAIFVATPSLNDFRNPASSPLVNMLEQARPLGTLGTQTGYWTTIAIPGEHGSHEHTYHVAAGLTAFCTAMAGLLLATAIYAWRLINPDEVKQMFGPIYRFLWNKWYFDELYNFIFVRPTLAIGRAIAVLDVRGIDGLINGIARFVRGFSFWFDGWIDRTFLDGAINAVARQIFAVGISLRAVQTGRLRQYVVLIVVGTVALFLVATFAIAGY